MHSLRHLDTFGNAFEVHVSGTLHRCRQRRGLSHPSATFPRIHTKVLGLGFRVYGLTKRDRWQSTPQEVLFSLIQEWGRGLALALPPPSPPFLYFRTHQIFIPEGTVFLGRGAHYFCISDEILSVNHTVDERPHTLI